MSNVKRYGLLIQIQDATRCEIMATPMDVPLQPHHFYVSVLLRAWDTPENPWQAERWNVEGVVVGQRAPRTECDREVLHQTSAERLYIFHGFSLGLYRDEAESYYQNLMAKNPSVFVHCRRGADGGLSPEHVTLSYAEADAYMEVDDDVFAVPMPAELYRWVEQFVLENYVPEKRKKRKRENWKVSQDSKQGSERVTDGESR